MPGTQVTVAARYDTRAAILQCEVIQRPHDPDQEFHSGIFDGIKRIIAVECLRGLAGQNLDRGQAADVVALAVRQQEIVRDFDDEVVVDELRRTGALLSKP